MGTSADRWPTETMEFPDSSCRFSCEMCSGASPERTSCEAFDISKPGQVSRLTKVSLVSGFALRMYAYTTACSAPAAYIGPAARTPTEKASAQTVAAVRNRCAIARLTASPRWPTTKVSSSGLKERQRPKPLGHHPLHSLLYEDLPARQSIQPRRDAADDRPTGQHHTEPAVTQLSEGSGPRHCASTRAGHDNQATPWHVGASYNTVPDQ